MNKVFKERTSVKVLRERAVLLNLSPAEAKARLLSIRDQITELLFTSDDAVRVKSIRTLSWLDRYGEVSLLMAALSAVVNPSPQMRKLLARKEKKREQFIKDEEKRHASWVLLLHRATGVDLPTCQKIVEARARSLKFDPKWPILAETVIGPKGSMPLYGNGAYWAIYEDQEEARRQKKLRGKKAQ